MQRRDSSPGRGRVGADPSTPIHTPPRRFSRNSADSASRDIYGDRFIPSRVSTNLEDAFDIMDSGREQRDRDQSIPEHQVTMNNLLRSELLGQQIPDQHGRMSGSSGGLQSLSPSRGDSGGSSNLFKYRSSVRSNESSDSAATMRGDFPGGSPNRHSVGSAVSSGSGGGISTPKKAVRKISKTPYKILDAPALQDDYYLNLVDWSHNNMLGVALGSGVFLWSASTSKVTKLCELAGDDSVTSISWATSGNHISVGMHSGKIEIWDSTTCTLVRRLQGHDSRVGTMAWNSNVLASGSKDRQIYLQDIRVRGGGDGTGAGGSTNSSFVGATSNNNNNNSYSSNSSHSSSRMSTGRIVGLGASPGRMDKGTLTGTNRYSVGSSPNRSLIGGGGGGAVGQHQSRPPAPLLSFPIPAHLASSSAAAEHGNDEEDVESVTGDYDNGAITGATINDDNEKQQQEEEEEEEECVPSMFEVPALPMVPSSWLNPPRTGSSGRPATAAASAFSPADSLSGSGAFSTSLPSSPFAVSSSSSSGAEAGAGVDLLGSSLSNTQLLSHLMDEPSGMYGAARGGSSSSRRQSSLFSLGGSNLGSSVVGHGSGNGRGGSSNVTTLRGHKQEVCGLKWSFDEKMLASGGNDNKLFVWDPFRGGRAGGGRYQQQQQTDFSSSSEVEPMCRFEDHTAAVKAVGWSPHQHGLLASGGGTADRHIRFWNALTELPMHKIDTGSQVCNLMWSKNVNEIVSTHGYSLNQVIVWKYPSMQKIATLTGHSLRVLYLAMSPDGQSVVTGAGDESLRFWNIFPGPRSKSGHATGASALAPSGMELR